MSGVALDHKLYTAADFTAAEARRGNTLYRHVVEGGLAVCKTCGGGESDLEVRCADRQRQAREAREARRAREEAGA